MALALNTTTRTGGVVALTTAAAVATALWVEYRARRAEREHPPAGRFVYVDGVRLHYRERGKGPAVVLLHGNVVTAQDFEVSGLMERLAQDHRVVAFDRPGFGHSERPRDREWTPATQAALLHRACASLGIERPVVLGHSLAALVALSLALDHPTSVSGLVLLNGYYYPELRVDALMAAPAAWPLVGDVMRHTVSALTARALLDRMVVKMFAPRPVPPAFLPQLSREMLVRPSALRAAIEDGNFMMAQARASAPRYAQLRLPLTLISGDADEVVDSQSHSARLHRELPHSRSVELPGVGHMPHHAALDTVADAIVEMHSHLQTKVGGGAAIDGLNGREGAADIPQPRLREVAAHGPG